jgi:L-threonylcarbamoyladenylate synthase
MLAMHSTSLDIQLAAQTIAAGELVGFPTETVYGLGADASSDAAVAKIYAAKGRPSDHPLIVHVASPSGVAHFASEVPHFAHQLIATFWPGPLTVILPRKPHVARASAGGQDSIGLRCPSHPMALSLLRECYKLGVQGVAAPSANRFGRVSPTSAAHVREEFGADYETAVGAPLLILEGGDCDVGIESTIVDCTRGVPVLLRPGVLTHQQLQVACGERVYLPSETPVHGGHAPKASGTLASHYAPRAKVRLVHGAEAKSIQAQQALGAPSTCQMVLYQLPATPQAAAHELFAKLREYDQTGIDLICVTVPPEGQAWDGVRDRLNRAAT